MIKTSVVILTYNSTKYIKSCLDSVFSQDHTHFEVIVVDNASNDDTIGFIKANYPQVVLIENKNNYGACKARNQGISVAGGKWILTLDCDIILQKDFISGMLKVINDLPPKVGIIQPKILNPDGKTIYSTGIYLSFLRRFYDIGKDMIDNEKFNIPNYVFGASSAAAIYKRDMLEEIKENTGYFDERFFFLVEDVDLSWRAQRRDWKAFYYPEAVCFHWGNSSNFEKKTRQYLCFRNRYLLIIKNERLNAIIRKMPFYLTYDIPRIIYLTMKYKGGFTLNNVRKNQE
jgi:GT2 family glycosyltransferase